ncbi:Hpt domain-containing protein [Benzoatithermus flavus]|uniref:Hpt domain-containing protein n=1 Tax=Benzoatithermus flavus TaxID=3108223 RepID=A0ABU8XN60_9PROT
MSAALHLEQVVAQLRARFNDELVPRLDRIRALTRALPTDPAAIRELQMAVHNIAGIAGTFGHPRLSATAARMDELLSQRVPEAIDHGLLARLAQDLHPDTLLGEPPGG